MTDEFRVKTLGEVHRVPGHHTSLNTAPERVDSWLNAIENEPIGDAKPNMRADIWSGSVEPVKLERVYQPRSRSSSR